MAPSTTRSRLKRPQKSSWIKNKLNFNAIREEFLRSIYDPDYSWAVAILLFVLEIFVTSIVICKIPYTEIDWKAYMQEVEGVLKGTLDYEQLKGDTGPLVYPAGFVYIYLILYGITNKGQNVFIGQLIFAILYLATLYLVFRLYTKSKKVPPYALIFMCCTSYRIHSIYVLRLFNDPVAFFFFILAVNFFVENKWTIGCLLYSFAVSVKMNILLFAPGLLLVLLHSTGLSNTCFFIGLCACLQVIVGLPFLLAHPVSYISRAYDFGRVFMHQWTVNWRFIPEDVFVSRSFHILLLIFNLIFLAAFFYKWIRNFGLGALTSKKEESTLSVDNLLFVLFTSNFVGVAFSRSLHYQFYVWYFFTLPHLLWSTHYNPVLKLSILGFLELSWNTYPSTVLSSGVLHLCHFLILVGLFHCSPSNLPEKTSKKC